MPNSLLSKSTALLLEEGVAATARIGLVVRIGASDRGYVFNAASGPLELGRLEVHRAFDGHFYVSSVTCAQKRSGVGRYLYEEAKSQLCLDVLWFGDVFTADGWCWACALYDQGIAPDPDDAPWGHHRLSPHPTGGKIRLTNGSVPERQSGRGCTLVGQSAQSQALPAAASSSRSSDGSERNDGGYSERDD